VYEPGAAEPDTDSEIPFDQEPDPAPGASTPADTPLLTDTVRKTGSGELSVTVLLPDSPCSRVIPEPQDTVACAGSAVIAVAALAKRATATKTWVRKAVNGLGLGRVTNVLVGREIEA
jgi:hypothetical protein